MSMGIVPRGREVLVLMPRCPRPRWQRRIGRDARRREVIPRERPPPPSLDVGAGAPFGCDAQTVSKAHTERRKQRERGQAKGRVRCCEGICVWGGVDWAVRTSAPRQCEACMRRWCRRRRLNAGNVEELGGRATKQQQPATMGWSPQPQPNSYSPFFIAAEKGHCGSPVGVIMKVACGVWGRVEV